MVTREKGLPARIRIVFVCALGLLSGCSRIIPTTQLTLTVDLTLTPAPTPTIQETIIPFETIEKTFHSTLEAYRQEEPLIVVITETNEVDAVSGWISDEARNEISALNFEDAFAIVVFQGFFTGGEHEVEIQRIIVRGNTVIVEAYFTEPPPNTQLVAIVTSPYHLVKLNKEGFHRSYKFVLKDDGKIIQEVEASFP